MEYRVEKNEPYDTWAIVELWSGGTVRSPFKSKEEAIKREEEIGQDYGWKLRLVESKSATSTTDQKYLAAAHGQEELLRFLTTAPGRESTEAKLRQRFGESVFNDAYQQGFITRTPHPSPSKRVVSITLKGRKQLEPEYLAATHELLPEGLRKKLPPIGYGGEQKDPMVYAKFFTPWTNWTWYAMEFDGKDIFFGWVVGLEKEFGSFSLSELESVRGPGGLRVERDSYFRTQPISQVMRAEGREWLAATKVEEPKYVRVLSAGQTVFQIYDIIEEETFNKENERVKKLGERPATGELWEGGKPKRLPRTVVFEDNVEVYTSEVLPPEVARGTGLHRDPQVEFRYTTSVSPEVDLKLFQRDLQRLLRERTGIYLAVDAYYIREPKRLPQTLGAEGPRGITRLDSLEIVKAYKEIARHGKDKISVSLQAWAIFPGGKRPHFISMYRSGDDFIISPLYAHIKQPVTVPVSKMKAWIKALPLRHFSPTRVAPEHTETAERLAREVDCTIAIISLSSGEHQPSTVSKVTPEIQTITQSLVEHIRGVPNVQDSYVFGSLARELEGEGAGRIFRPESDIDVAVLIPRNVSSAETIKALRQVDELSGHKLHYLVYASRAEFESAPKGAVISRLVTKPPAGEREGKGNGGKELPATVQGEPIPDKYRELMPFIDEPLPPGTDFLVPAVAHRGIGHGEYSEEGERKIDTVLRQLKDGVESIQDSTRFRLFLTTMSKFHDYSIGNLILIAMQKPDATRVAGFATWKDLGRWVKKGAKGIAILAPVMPPKPKEEEEEEVELTPVYFKVVHVFDLSQTEGKPLPEFEVPVLTGEANEELFAKVMALAKAQGLDISFESRPQQDPSIKGQYLAKSIWVRPEESRAQQLKSLIHEVAHYYSEGVFRIPRRDAETIAESAAFAIGAHSGFDSGVRSFPYVAVWAQDKKVLQQNLESIRKVTRVILESLEKMPEPSEKLIPALKPFDPYKFAEYVLRNNVFSEDEILIYSGLTGIHPYRVPDRIWAEVLASIEGEFVKQGDLYEVKTSVMERPPDMRAAPTWREVASTVPPSRPITVELTPKQRDVVQFRFFDVGYEWVTVEGNKLTIPADRVEEALDIITSAVDITRDWQGPAGVAEHKATVALWQKVAETAEEAGYKGPFLKSIYRGETAVIPTEKLKGKDVRLTRDIPAVGLKKGDIVTVREVNELGDVWLIKQVSPRETTDYGWTRGEMVELLSPAVIPTAPSPPSPRAELEFVADSPEFLAFTIEDIGFREKLDTAFEMAIARAKGG